MRGNRRQFLKIPDTDSHPLITKLPESRGNVIGFVITGQLADKDYQQGLIPPVEEVIRANPKFRVLFQMQEFTGWTAHGAGCDFANGPKFLSCERNGDCCL